MKQSITAADVPCYAVYSNDFHYSDTWANQLIDLWIETKRKLAAGQIRVEDFRGELIDGIIEAANWRDDFAQAAAAVGADPDDDDLYYEYEELHREGAFDLIPSNLYSEFCWIPEWDGRDLDDLIETHGQRSDRYNSNYIEEVQPGNWLRILLQLVNQSLSAVIDAATEMNPEAGNKFAEKCKKANFTFEHDPARPNLMTGAQVVAAIENGYTYAVPLYHCFVNVRALFEFDPGKAMRMSSKKGEVHLGLHDGVLNGTGYMDTYPGEVVIPVDAIGFLGTNRMRWGVDKVYGLVRSYFFTTPVAVE